MLQEKIQKQLTTAEESWVCHESHDVKEDVLELAIDNMVELYAELKASKDHCSDETVTSKRFEKASNNYREVRGKVRRALAFEYKNMKEADMLVHICGQRFCSMVREEGATSQ